MLDPKVAESLQFLHDIIHVDGSAPIPGSDTMDNQYLAGQVSMINRGHWVIPNIKNAKLNSDVAIPPTKVNDYTVVGFGAVGIAKGAKNMDAVQAMVAELTGPEAEADVAKSGSAVPGSKAAAELPEYLAFPPSAPLFYADAAAHQGGAVAGQLPGSREDLHPLLHRHHGGRDVGRRWLQAGRRRAQRLVRAAKAVARPKLISALLPSR